jgi:hypothetical protein
MAAAEHRKILAQNVRSSLSPYANFAEVEDLLALVSAWEMGRVAMEGGIPVFCAGEDLPRGLEQTATG